MVAIKTSFFIIVFIAVIVTRQSTALCATLLKQEFAVNLGPFDAQDNFKKSFQSLSLKQFEMKYGGPQRTNESIEDFRKRKIQKELSEGYFLDLFAEQRIDVTNRQMPIDWCKAKVSVVLDLSLRSPIRNCESYIIQRLFDNEHMNLDLSLEEPEIMNSEEPTNLDLSLALHNRRDVSQDIIFKMFYEKWSIADIHHYRTTALRGQSLQDHDFFEVFNSYFRHYEKKVITYRADLMIGRFRSVDAYCELKGHKVIINNLNSEQLQNE